MPRHGSRAHQSWESNPRGLHVKTPSLVGMIARERRRLATTHITISVCVNRVVCNVVCATMFFYLLCLGDYFCAFNLSKLRQNFASLFIGHSLFTPHHFFGFDTSDCFKVGAVFVYFVGVPNSVVLQSFCFLIPAF